MEARSADVVVAGHICLDIIPTFEARGGAAGALLTPGKLVNVGAAITATGGAVSNTGLALHRLGVPTRLMGKVGADLFGRAVLDILRGYDPALAQGMVTTRGEQSSYTVVISPPGVDRYFLHCPGANDTFGAEDVNDAQVAHARLFHFGYPPIMRRMYADGGRELASIFERVRAHGVTTSLDMALPDPDSEAGRADWPTLLTRVLPFVDVFLPSLEETLFMLHRNRFEEMERSAGSAGLMSQVDGALLHDLSGRLLEMGAAIAVLKLGHQGLYLRTTDDADRLATAGKGVPEPLSPWQGRELLAPCFRVRVVGTTGSGDCTIAGFLTGLLKGLSPGATMTDAVGVGACNVEQADATSGVPSWPAVQDRIRAGWARLPVTLPLPGWEWDGDQEIWRGPNDGGHS